jgi:hypothetical protein
MTVNKMALNKMTRQNAALLSNLVLIRILSPSKDPHSEIGI